MNTPEEFQIIIESYRIRFENANKIIASQDAELKTLKTQSQSQSKAFKVLHDSMEKNVDTSTFVKIMQDYAKSC